MPQATAAVYVEGQEIGATWYFRVICSVYDPATKVWRSAKLGEVRVWLSKEGFLGFHEQLRAGNSGADGEVHFNTGAAYPSAIYRIEGQHSVSKSVDGVRIECHSDGTFEQLERYTPGEVPPVPI